MTARSIMFATFYIISKSKHLVSRVLLYRENWVFITGLLNFTITWWKRQLRTLKPAVDRLKWPISTNWQHGWLLPVHWFILSDTLRLKQSWNIRILLWRNRSSPGVRCAFLYSFTAQPDKRSSTAWPPPAVWRVRWHSLGREIFLPLAPASGM